MQVPGSLNSTYWPVALMPSVSSKVSSATLTSGISFWSLLTRVGPANTVNEKRISPEKIVAARAAENGMLSNGVPLNPFY